MNFANERCRSAMKTRLPFAAAVCLLTSLALAPSAGAGTITNSFVGTVTNASASTPAAMAGVSTGQIVTGYFTFSDDPANHLGGDRYRATTSLSLGNLEFAIDADTTYIRVRDGGSPGTPDFFTHGFDSIGPLPETLPYYVYELGVEFTDSSGALFAAPPALPYSPAVSNFNVARWRISGTRVDTDAGFSFSGRILLTTPSDSLWKIDQCLQVSPTDFPVKVSWRTPPGLAIHVLESTNLTRGSWTEVDAASAGISNGFFQPDMTPTSTFIRVKYAVE